MKQDLPLVVRVPVSHVQFDPDAVNAEVYCVNTTGQTFAISTSSESFTTIDEEDGTAVGHGSPPGRYLLEPGEWALIADVKGWEWDGHVGIELTFQVPGDSAIAVRHYDFKQSSADFTIAAAGKNGRLILPTE